MDDDYLGGLTWFEIEKIEKAYVVGDEYDMDKAALEYLEQLYDDIGFDGLPDWLIESSIDVDNVVETFRLMYEDDIQENPDVYLEDSERELSQEQKHEVEKRDFVSKDLNKKVKAFKLAQQNETDSEKLSFIEKTISLFETKLAQLESQKEKILEDPQGEFSEDVIEREIEARLEYVKEWPVVQLKDYGLNIGEYIDRKKIYQTVLDNDGYEVMSPYDGEVNEEIVNGDTFYIIRIE
jgi:glutamyl/glutaminyl-tRNA synthetase